MDKQTKSLQNIIYQSRPKAKIKSQVKKVDKETTESETINEIDIKDVELINPCKDITLKTKINLRPDHMNNDLYYNLKKNLIDKVEGKCIEYGYVIKVYRILDYSNGYVEAENFTGCATYEVLYLAKVCIPVKDNIIVAKITSYIPNVNFVIAEFGNIQKIIFTKTERDMYTKLFEINKDNIKHIPTQKILAINDNIKIQLKSIRLYQNDTTIQSMGYVVDIATPSEVSSYGFTNEIKLNKLENLDNSIYLNEDNDVEDINVDNS